MINKHLVLIGMMGSGKTTVGKYLSQKMGLDHIDLDHYIEEQTQTDISTFIQKNGLENFRILEEKYLKKLFLELNHFVILSLGGGTPIISSDWYSIYLKADVSTLSLRLQDQLETRPLLQGLSQEKLQKKIALLLQERNAHYQKANLHIQTDNFSVEEVALEIYKKVKSHEN